MTDEVAAVTEEEAKLKIAEMQAAEAARSRVRAEARARDVPFVESDPGSEKPKQKAKTKFRFTSKSQVIDPWEHLLWRFELRTTDPAGHIVKVVNKDGKLEWRVISRFILAAILKIPREGLRAPSKRLGGVMRRLGWIGPVSLRFGSYKARGYRKTIED